MKKLLLVIACCCCATWASAQVLVVAAAADLSSVFPQVAEKFEKETGKQVRINYGSSGQFLLQIENGAPFDVFFSADLQYPQRLESEGLTQPGSIYKYAVGKLVLYVPNGSPSRSQPGVARTARSHCKEDCHRQSAARSVWSRRRRGFQERGSLRRAAKQVRDGRKHLAGGSVRAVRKR